MFYPKSIVQHFQDSRSVSLMSHALLTCSSSSLRWLRLKQDSGLNRGFMWTGPISFIIILMKNEHAEFMNQVLMSSLIGLKQLPWLPFTTTTHFDFQY